MTNPRQPYLEVAYPGGFISEPDVLHVCYGKNDQSIRVLTVDKERLFNSMAKVLRP
jgi:predicted GH43/DUF377 family glycosyl hydrolase